MGQTLKNGQLADFLKANAPCYLYDGKTVEAQIAKLREHLPGFTVLYSVKTNPFGRVVDAVAANGVGADAASYREVEIAAAHGISQDLIYYSAPGKTQRDLQRAFGKCVLIADSITELALIDAIAKDHRTVCRAGLRINPNFTMLTGTGAPGKFGVDEEQVFSRMDEIRRLSNITLCGIHVHVQSQVLDFEVLGRYYTHVFELALRLHSELGMAVDFINFGGGIGTVYDKTRHNPLDFEKLSEITGALVERNRKCLGAKLIVESGRFIICAAGTYYTRIVDIKESRGQKYLIVQNGLNGFMRPAIAALVQFYAKSDAVAGQEPLYTLKNAFEVSVLNGRAERETVNIVGNLCTATDILANGVEVGRAKIGDIVSVSNAGSYACTLSPLLFSGHDAPREFYLDAAGHMMD